MCDWELQDYILCFCDHRILKQCRDCPLGAVSCGNETQSTLKVQGDCGAHTEEERLEAVELRAEQTRKENEIRERDRVRNERKMEAMQDNQGSGESAAQGEVVATLKRKGKQVAWLCMYKAVGKLWQ